MTFVNSVNLFCQRRIHFSNTCTVTLGSTCTMCRNMHLYFAKVQVQNHSKRN